ncbi:hypothetical protein GCM10023115_49880 [Pontixanthobacter gangjinensis]|uniref:Matrixin family metalloprotease n=1 Tax=Christiangramia aestuarii TaxID=1028746 RepID=A0A7K1LP38_9FLAO|nr:hypothetical protein [Christiangramia aestuarii]MUP42569.1 hypothetical protein [Christiangramia aestuarii]
MRTIKLSVLILSLILVSCSQESEIDSTDLNQQEVIVEPIFREVGDEFKKIPLTNISDFEKRSEGNFFVSLYSAEYLTLAENGEMGNTVYFMDRGNKQLGSDFSPLLSIDGTTDISYYIDETRASEDLNIEETTGSIMSAMNTWEDVKCSELGLFRVPSNNEFSTGLIAQILGYGGEVPFVAEINHAGWLPGEFFEMALGEDAATRVLGVTYTLIFIDENGNPLDTNEDGLVDTALREIYYNDNFQWNIDGNSIDVETVALHEAGHGLSQAHFGKLFEIKKTEKFQFAPRAVMNAGYTGVQNEIGKTDNAGHCSIWDYWPEE